MLLTLGAWCIDWSIYYVLERQHSLAYLWRNNGTPQHGTVYELGHEGQKRPKACASSLFCFQVKEPLSTGFGFAELQERCSEPVQQDREMLLGVDSTDNAHGSNGKSSSCKVVVDKLSAQKTME